MLETPAEAVSQPNKCTRPSPQHLPYEILALIVHFSDIAMYLAYTQTNTTFRRIVYEDITIKGSIPTPGKATVGADDRAQLAGLAMHLLKCQKLSASAMGDIERIHPPEYRLWDWVGQNRRVLLPHYSARDDRIRSLEPGWRTSGHYEIDALRVFEERWERLRANRRYHMTEESDLEFRRSYSWVVEN